MSGLTEFQQKREALHALALAASDHMRADVARGVAALDAVTPAWRDCVHMDLFDITDHRRCILGQVYGDYQRGIAVLNRTAVDEGTWVAYVRSHGMLVTSDETPSAASRSGAEATRSTRP